MYIYLLTIMWRCYSPKFHGVVTSRKFALRSVYQWLDDKGKKVKVTAAQYIEYVTAFTQKTICDESIFPTKYGV